MNMLTLTEAVKRAVRDPDLWLGTISVISAWHFESGFRYAAQACGSAELCDTVSYHAFLSSLPCTGDRNAYINCYLSYYDDAEAWRVFAGEIERLPEERGARKAKNIGALDQVIVETFAALEAKPGMFVGNQDITSLRSFLGGFRMGLESFAGSDKLTKMLTDFEIWLQAKHDRENRCRWDRLLVAEVGFSSYGAYPRFFERWREFVHEYA